MCDVRSRSARSTAPGRRGPHIQPLPRRRQRRALCWLGELRRDPEVRGASGHPPRWRRARRTCLQRASAPPAHPRWLSGARHTSVDDGGVAAPDDARSRAPPTASSVAGRLDDYRPGSIRSDRLGVCRRAAHLGKRCHLGLVRILRPAAVGRVLAASHPRMRARWTQLCAPRAASGRGGAAVSRPGSACVLPLDPLEIPAREQPRYKFASPDHCPGDSRALGA
eukprot:scaffold55_cov401-Prasinococcus_capsulatus_cf.AAC.16